MIKEVLHKHKTLWIGILLALVPFLGALLFCLKDGRFITDVYMPLGGWSDEIHYYKQIEGMIDYIIPKGYFGYNQSKAVYGPFAVWGIFPLIPYALYGALFGWTYTSPMLANILFSTLAILFFYVLCKPKKIKLIPFALLWISFPFVNRYVLSGVVEISILAQVMMLFSSGWYLFKEDREDSSFTTREKWIMVISLFLISYLTMQRPYFAVFFLMPFWKAVKVKKKGLALGISVWMLMVFAGFFMNSGYFCSTYYANVLDFNKLMQDGVGGIFVKLYEGFIGLARYTWYGIRYRGTAGWIYVFIFIEWLYFFYIIVRKYFLTKKADPLLTSCLIGEVLILVCILIMYDIDIGARHMLAFAMSNMVFMVLHESDKWLYGMLVISIISWFLMRGFLKLPYQNEEYSQWMEQLEASFAEEMIVTNELSYDNVIAMPTSDVKYEDGESTVATYYGLMFAIPSGMGLSIDQEKFYNNPVNLKAKYYLVHPEGTIRLKLEQMGMECIIKDKEFLIYCKEK